MFASFSADPRLVRAIAAGAVFALIMTAMASGPVAAANPMSDPGAAEVDGGLETLAVPGAPAPIRPLPVCERLQDPPTGACPLESEYFTLSSSGSIDGSAAAVLTLTPSVPPCNTGDSKDSVWSPSTCYTQIGFPPTRTTVPVRCVYLDDATGLLTPCLSPFQDSFTSWNAAVGRSGDWIQNYIHPEARTCNSVSFFDLWHYGGPGGSGLTWPEVAALTGDCDFSMESTPDNLMGASWLIVTAYLEVVRPGEDAAAPQIEEVEWAEIYVGINGTLGPFAEVPDPDPDPDPSSPFTDVPADSFAVDDIALLLDLGITNGVSPTEYGPSREVTREQMAAFLARMWIALGNDCPDIDNPFADISTDSFAYDSVACIFGLGVTTGVSSTAYDPSAKVTREQMAAFLARLWQAAGNDCESGPTSFTDVPATSFAVEYIECLFHLKITKGTSASTYGRSEFVTREQMAAFLGRLYRSHTS